MRPWIALSQGVRQINAKRDLYPFNRIEEEQAQLLVEQVKINSMPKLGSRSKLFAADHPARIGRIRYNFLKWLPVECQPTVTNALQMMNCPGLIGDSQSALHEKRELVSETEMGFGIGRKHRPLYEEGRPLMPEATAGAAMLSSS